MKKLFLFVIVALLTIFLFFCGRKEAVIYYKMDLFLLKGSKKSFEQTMPLFSGETSVSYIQNVFRDTQELEEQLKNTFGYSAIELLDAKVFPFERPEKLNEVNRFIKLANNYYADLRILPSPNPESFSVSIKLYSFPTDTVFPGFTIWKKLVAAKMFAMKQEPLYSLRAEVPISQGVILGRPVSDTPHTALFLVLRPIRMTEKEISVYKKQKDLTGEKDFVLSSDIHLKPLQIYADSGYVPFYALDEKPSLVHRDSPEYPESARKSGFEGMVVVKVLINEQGKVARTWVVKSTGNKSLDSSAVAAAEKFEFTPGKKAEQPVKVQMTIPFNFKLKK